MRRWMAAAAALGQVLAGAAWAGAKEGERQGEGKAGGADPAVERWAPLPEAIASFGAAAEGGWLYVYSGHIGRAHAHSRDNLSRSFRRLNLVDRASWEEFPAGPPLQGLGLVAHAGRIIRAGGLSARNAAGEPADLYSVTAAAAFDPLRREWRDLPSLPEPRSSHDLAVAGGRLYAIGGWCLEGTEERWHETA